MQFRTAVDECYRRIEKPIKAVSLYRKVPRSHMQRLLAEYDPEEFDARYGSRVPLHKTLPSKNSPDPIVSAEQSELRADVDGLLSQFSDKPLRQDIARGRFLSEETQQEVASRLDIPVTRIRTMEGKIYRTLKEPLKSLRIVGHLD